MKLPSLHPRTWAWDLLCLVTAQDRAIIFCGMWSLWTLRNNRKHGEPMMPIKQAVHWVRDTTFDLWELSHPQRAEAQA